MVGLKGGGAPGCCGGGGWNVGRVGVIAGPGGGMGAGIPPGTPCIRWKCRFRVTGFCQGGVSRTSRTVESTMLFSTSAWNSAYPSCGCATSKDRACSGCEITNA